MLFTDGPRRPPAARGLIAPSKAQGQRRLETAERKADWMYMFPLYHRQQPELSYSVSFHRLSPHFVYRQFFAILRIASFKAAYFISFCSLKQGFFQHSFRHSSVSFRDHSSLAVCTYCSGQEVLIFTVAHMYRVIPLNSGTGIGVWCGSAVDDFSQGQRRCGVGLLQSRS